MNHSPIIFPLFGYDDLAHAIQKKCHYDLGNMTLHQFPDEETVIKIESRVADRQVFFITSLDKPNIKLLPLLFASQTAKSLGASAIVLIAPYLSYMRQDKVFEPGQGITSLYFAKLLSRYFDGLITIDPHLHRWHSLDELYEIPTKVLHATDPIADWLRTSIKKPILIGPDIESTQWVKEIASKASVPFLILEKNRRGDDSVVISVHNIEQYKDFVPVLIDDIISTGVTMRETVKILKKLEMPRPICIGVHGLFSGDAYDQLSASGVEDIITCNTIRHSSNSIDVSNELIKFLKTGSGFTSLF